jgi:hypothetical protein
MRSQKQGESSSEGRAAEEDQREGSQAAGRAHQKYQRGGNQRVQQAIGCAERTELDGLQNEKIEFIY